MKKIISLALSAMFIISALTLGVFAEDENPVVNITAEAVEIVENYHGWKQSSYYDDEKGILIEKEWFAYSAPPKKVTITYKNGEVISGSRQEIFEKTGYSVDYYENQSGKNPWGVGEHTATASFLGVECEYVVKVIENPVASVTAEDIEIIENYDGHMADGYNDENGNFIEKEWFVYDVPPKKITITYKNGTVVSGTPEEIRQKTGYGVYCSTDQNGKNPWGLGEHTATASFLGVECEYAVKIIESPIASITAEDFEVIENFDGGIENGYYDKNGAFVEKSWFKYEAVPKKITITYKNGDVVSGADRWEIEKKTGGFVNYNTDQSGSSPWGLGEHTATLTFMGATGEYKVKVVENPVASVKVDSIDTKENANGVTSNGYYDKDGTFIEKKWYIYDVTPKKITVTYKDGRIISGSPDEILKQTGYKVEFSSDQSGDNPWKAGTHSAKISFMGVSFNYEVKIKPAVVIIDSSKKFIDVKPDAWYKEYVDYAVSYKLFNGTSNNTFEPEMWMTRAMFVKALFNISGTDNGDYAVNSFRDVEKGRWYSEAISWAAANGIVNGISDTEFAPNQKITREQMCTMLIRYADYLGIALNKTADGAAFDDDSQISSWAKDAVYACQSAGIVNGMTETTFEPKGTATRAQASKILSVFHKDYLLK